MPKISVNYSRTQMYKIVCKDLTITYTYVGHTTNWTKRKSKHKCNCHNENSREYHFQVYRIIRENGGWDNWTMILIEDYPCENRLQAEQRERYWIETLNANLNKVIPSRTIQEWKEEHKEYIKIYNTNYYQEHKEDIKIYNTNYYQKNREKIICECGAKVIRRNMSNHKKSKKHQDYINSKEN